jgi:hypothetical protein
MYQVASDQYDRAVGESNCKLRQIIETHESGHLATIDISSLTRKAEENRPAVVHTGNCLSLFCTDTVERHLGPPVFLSTSSKAHSFRTGSVDKSSAMVIR